MEKAAAPTPNAAVAVPPNDEAPPPNGAAAPNAAGAAVAPNAGAAPVLNVPNGTVAAFAAGATPALKGLGVVPPKAVEAAPKAFVEVLLLKPVEIDVLPNPPDVDAPPNAGAAGMKALLTLLELLALLKALLPAPKEVVEANPVEPPKVAVPKLFVPVDVDEDPNAPGSAKLGAAGPSEASIVGVPGAEPIEDVADAGAGVVAANANPEVVAAAVCPKEEKDGADAEEVAAVEPLKEKAAATGA
jgi:hypothetical protein